MNSLSWLLGGRIAAIVSCIVVPTTVIILVVVSICVAVVVYGLSTRSHTEIETTFGRCRVVIPCNTSSSAIMLGGILFRSCWLLRRCSSVGVKLEEVEVVIGSCSRLIANILNALHIGVECGAQVDVLGVMRACRHLIKVERIAIELIRLDGR